MSDDTLTLTITDLSRTGAGVARSGEAVVFVTGALPGETVRARITGREKRYWNAALEEVLVASPDRQIPRCAVFGRCGGCDLQHMSYAQQWALKLRGLKHGLGRVQLGTWAERLDLWEEFPAQDPWHYRNRIQLRGMGDEVGYYARGSKLRIPITECPIARPEINAVLPQVRAQGEKLKGEYKVEVALAADGAVQTHWNQPHGAAGFRQVNDAQNLQLQNWIHSLLEGQCAEGLLDLYGGQGNLSASLRATGVRVSVVDVGAPVDALHGFFRISVDRWIKSTRGVRASAAILDPPREGLGELRKEIIATLGRLGVKALVHVGCDSDAWARDMRAYSDAGWRVHKLAAFDFFPQTRHVEAAAFLVKTESSS